MTAEERRKASGPLIGPRPRQRNEARQPWCAVRRSASLFGEQRQPPPVRSRQAFLKRERRPGCEPHRGNAVLRRHRRVCCLTLWIGTLFPPPRSGGGGPPEHARSARRVVEGARDAELRCRCRKMMAMKLLRSCVEENRANLKSAYDVDSHAALPPAPPPPPSARCASLGWSPSPASRGRIRKSAPENRG